MDVLTVEDVAKELSVSPGWVRRLAQDGKLGRKVGRQWLFTSKEVEDYKRNRKPPGRPKNS